MSEDKEAGRGRRYFKNNKTQKMYFYALLIVEAFYEKKKVFCIFLCLHGLIVETIPTVSEKNMDSISFHLKYDLKSTG